MELQIYNQNAIEIKNIENAIITCDSVQEIKQNIYPKISGILELLTRAGILTIEQENKLRALKSKAELKLAQLLSELEKQHHNQNTALPDIKTDSEYTQVLKDYKINEREAQRLQKIVNLKDSDIDELEKKANEESRKLLKKDMFEKAKKQEIRKMELNILKQDINNQLPVNIKLLEGDIFDKINEIDNNSIDLFITDPPYFMNKADWDIFDNKDEFINFTKKWIDNILIKLKKDYQIFICFNSEYFIDLELICRGLELPIKSRLIWHYRNAGGKSQGKYMFSKTYDVILHIGNKELNFNENWSDERFDVWTIAIPQSNFDEGKYHITQKPIELFKRLIKLGSKENDLILDCFAGSGTAGIVCQELNRNCILIEKEKEYCNIIRNRINGI